VSLLYICYLGVTEPLVRTQVIPYLEGLASGGYRVVLLSFEPRPLSGDERRSWRGVLQRTRIEWHALRYHKRPALPATLADILAGIAYAAYIIRTRRVGIVHARGHVPAAIAVALKWLLGTRFVFDIRGLMADEYADAGLWKRGGTLFRLVKRMENRFIAQADAAVVLTRRARQWLFDIREPQSSGRPVEIIPCCVDLRRFEVDHPDTRRLREHLGLDGHPVLVYAGKLGGWYMAGEMAEFFRTARRYFPDLHFLILTQSAPVVIEQELARRHVGRAWYRCLRVPPEELPAYLTLADFAISFRTPSFSQMASSPTKIAEYLAAGLPIVHNAGIGDLDDLEEDEVGAEVVAFTGAEYDRAAREVQILLEDREATVRRCRAAAERHFSLAAVGIPRYLRLYAGLVGRQAPAAPAAARSASRVEEAAGRGSAR